MDIVYHARVYLEVRYYTIFVIARFYFKMTLDRDEIDEEYNRWRKKGVIPKHLEDFCLKVLTGKLKVRWNQLKPAELLMEEDDGKEEEV